MQAVAHTETRRPNKIYEFAPNASPVSLSLRPSAHNETNSIFHDFLFMSANVRILINERRIKKYKKKRHTIYLYGLSGEADLHAIGN